jgi:hypothetical protein
MRKAILLVAVVLFTAPAFASADVLIRIDKARQRMTVSVDGAPRHQWSVSTGRARFNTPNGTYAPQRLERRWFSRKYYNSPMPHSIFFHRGYAIHGSYDISRLGGPASHGCVRLHPQHAATLFALVRSAGAGATTIVVAGETMIAQPPASSRRRSVATAGPGNAVGLRNAVRPSNKAPATAAAAGSRAGGALGTRTAAGAREPAIGRRAPPLDRTGWAGWGRSVD